MPQDLPHKYELRTVERMYQEYFPNEHLGIRIQYDEHDVYPVALTLTTTRHDDSDTKDVFEKPWNSDTVYCKRYMLLGKAYHKTQTIKKEQPWVYTGRVHA
jgi:hypothetical protein